jgi:hypothetical protein
MEPTHTGQSVWCIEFVIGNVGSEKEEMQGEMELPFLASLDSSLLTFHDHVCLCLPMSASLYADVHLSTC